MFNVTLECEVLDCGKPATYVSTVRTANYRESSHFCDAHKDSGYVPGVRIEK